MNDKFRQKLKLWSSKNNLQENADLLGISYEAAQMFAYRNKLKYVRNKYKRTCPHCGYSK